MDWDAHRTFGRIIADQYGKPVDGYMDWTILPDLRYYKESYFKYLIFHRWTLHGPENINVVIDQGKHSSRVTYDEENDYYIRCLIMSHSFLDLFNFVLHPSYPGAYGLVYIPQQLWRIMTFQAMKAPSGLARVLQEMASLHSGPADLFYTMLGEYRALPNKGYWIKQLLKLYR